MTPNHRLPTPSAPAAVAKRDAPFLLINPRTKGRFRVRLIIASYFGSNSIFKAFAEALQSAVPDVRKIKVIADNEGEAVVVGKRSVGTGYSEYAVAVVRTIRKERRGFESERQVVASRRKDAAGIVADIVER